MDESVEAVDLITLVQRDHREIEGLLDQVERADDGARTTLFSDVVQKLEAHEAAEADIVHALMRDLGAPDIADDLVEEEKLAKHGAVAARPVVAGLHAPVQGVQGRRLDPRATRGARGAPEHSHSRLTRCLGTDGRTVRSRLRCADFDCRSKFVTSTTSLRGAWNGH